MGQQQLLLLVLATVIVGLATVAGIQAFDEGQTQATQDALTQRALTIGNDIYAAVQKPSQLGGVSLSNSNVKAYAAAAGYGSTQYGISAEGAGSKADCDLAHSTGPNKVTVKCASEGQGTDGNTTSEGQYVAVEVTSSGATVTNINGNSNVGS